MVGGTVGLFLTVNIPPELPQPKAATIIYDVNQKEVARLFQENRIPITFNRIPQTMKDAIVAVEDRGFYEHRGISVRGIARAVFVDLITLSKKQGASTITQQLARNTQLSHKKDFKRKIKEIIIAIKYEQTLTKEEILEKYLNQIYFGHGSYGIETASQLYFGKHVWELKLHQYALLASLPKGPTNYSPYDNPNNALERRGVVLSVMASNGYITEDEAERANKMPLDIVPLRSSRGQAPYFVDYILRQLKDLGFEEETLYTKGYKIYTTLDNQTQAAAEAAMAKLPGNKPDAAGVVQPQCALVAIDPKNGYIKAMIGGRDFAITPLNRSTRALRQPGSAIKPFVYTAAIDSHEFTPASVLVDEPLSFPQGDGTNWEPKNSDGIFRGPITLREALENSVNTIAIKLVDHMGPGKVMAYGKRMGLDSLVASGAKNDLNFSAMALGGLTKGVTPLDLASSYTPLANRGILSEPIAILQVRDDQGNILAENTPKKRVVLREETAFLLTDMLRGVIEQGTGRRAQIGRPAAGKTGTSSDYTNAWFVGYTPDLVASVWIGNDSQSVPVKVNGAVLSSSAAAGIWGDFMKQAMVSTPVSDFTPPTNIVTGIEICANTGYLASPLCPDIRMETFISGTEPKEMCPMHGLGEFTDMIYQDICLDSEAIASQECPKDRVVRRYYYRESGLEIREGTQMPMNRCSIHEAQQTVSVRICTDSGLLATPFCPRDRIVTQTFARGEQPTIYCNLHTNRTKP